MINLARPIFALLVTICMADAPFVSAAGDNQSTAGALFGGLFRGLIGTAVLAGQVKGVLSQGTQMVTVGKDALGNLNNAQGAGNSVLDKGLSGLDKIVQNAIASANAGLTANVNTVADVAKTGVNAAKDTADKTVDQTLNTAKTMFDQANATAAVNKTADRPNIRHHSYPTSSHTLYSRSSSPRRMIPSAVSA